ncbi:unnamed protein product [Moneuplotes crassus]|uniref:Uncharacterized protein n=1 Tax=Euplotes crassus TaxID=5936 RepID=A0AAD2D4B9_EUPCR|nr:unnamed protein product [Moneuplotes crassus]
MNYADSRTSPKDQSCLKSSGSGDKEKSLKSTLEMSMEKIESFTLKEKDFEQIIDDDHFTDDSLTKYKNSIDYSQFELTEINNGLLISKKEKEITNTYDLIDEQELGHIPGYRKDTLESANKIFTSTYSSDCDLNSYSGDGQDFLPFSKFSQHQRFAKTEKKAKGGLKQAEMGKHPTQKYKDVLETMESCSSHSSDSEEEEDDFEDSS